MTSHPETLTVNDDEDEDFCTEAVKGLQTSDFELQTLDFFEDYFINCSEIILLIKI